MKIDNLNNRIKKLENLRKENAKSFQQSYSRKTLDVFYELEKKEFDFKGDFNEWLKQHEEHCQNTKLGNKEYSEKTKKEIAEITGDLIDN